MTRDSFPIVVHTFLARGDEVVLLRRANTGFADGMYGLPGGHVHAGERVTGAAIRECREEAGVEIDRADLEPLCVMPYIMDAGQGILMDAGQGIDFIFRCERFRGEPRIGEPDRCDDLRWFPSNALPDNTIGFVRVALEHLDGDAWLIEHGWGPD